MPQVFPQPGCNPGQVRRSSFEGTRALLGDHRHRHAGGTILHHTSLADQVSVGTILGAPATLHRDRPVRIESRFAKAPALFGNDFPHQIENVLGAPRIQQASVGQGAIEGSGSLERPPGLTVGRDGPWRGRCSRHRCSRVTRGSQHLFDRGAGAHNPAVGIFQPIKQVGSRIVVGGLYRCDGPSLLFSAQGPFPHQCDQNRHLDAAPCMTGLETSKGLRPPGTAQRRHCQSQQPRRGFGESLEGPQGSGCEQRFAASSGSVSSSCCPSLFLPADFLSHPDQLALQGSTLGLLPVKSCGHPLGHLGGARAAAGGDQAPHHKQQRRRR